MAMFSFDWNSISGGAPYVTLTSLGISFNSVAISKLGNPEKVLIGFDEKNLAIGIKPFENENGIKVYEFASRVKNGWIRIGCKDFIKYLQKISGIDFSEAKRYIAKTETDTGIMYVSVKDQAESDNENEEQ